MKFRSDITFLRAFSVLSVLLFHFKFSNFPGGFIGVDIFFVISGYLMTRIILSSIEKDSFNLLYFYEKRVIRIFPALLFMVATFGTVIYSILPTQIIPFLQSAFSSSLFFSNIYYYLNSGYFDASSQFNFLLHTWSLSVEWQFYMIYPLILLCVKNRVLKSKTSFKIYFFTIAIISFTIMLICNSMDNPLSFYMFFTRAWEMMFGGFAFLFAEKFQTISNRLKNILVIICLLILACCVYAIKDYTVTWPSLLTLIPVLSTVLILLANVDFAIFKNKVVNYLGNISYSLYLWHWPLYVLSLNYGFNSRLRHRLFFILLSFVLATVSYYLIEKREYKKKTKYILAAALIIFSSSFSLSEIDPQLYFKNSLGKLVDVAGNYKNSRDALKQYSFGKKHLSHNQEFSDYNLKSWEPAKSKKNVVLLGDSHAGMFGQTMFEIAQDKSFNLIQATTDATFPKPQIKSKFEGPEKLMNYFFSMYFPKNYKNIDLVVISANYKDHENYESKVQSVVNYFSKYNARILFIGQTDTYDLDFPTTYYLKIKNNKSKNATIANTLLKNKLGDHYLDVLTFPIKEVRDGMPYMYDRDHFTYYGTNQLKDLISNHLNLVK